MHIDQTMPVRLYTLATQVFFSHLIFFPCYTNAEVLHEAYPGPEGRGAVRALHRASASAAAGDDRDHDANDDGGNRKGERTNGNGD